MLDDGTLLKRYRKEICELKKQLTEVFVSLVQVKHGLSSVPFIIVIICTTGDMANWFVIFFVSFSDKPTVNTIANAGVTVREREGTCTQRQRGLTFLQKLINYSEAH